MIYPLLPLFLTASLGAGALVVGAIEGAAESVAALLKLASGWWSDRLARRKPLVVAGYALSSFARPLVAFVNSVPQLLVVRLVDRVGKGVRSSPRDALLANAVPASERGRAFGVHRAADHLGAVIGPLVAFALLGGAGLNLRTVFMLAAVPAALAVAVLVLGVRETPVARVIPTAASASLGPAGALPRPFWGFVAAVLLFTLGNSSDAFLLLRARDLGIPTEDIPLLWALFHVVKVLSSVPAGSLSDRVGRRPLILGGWTLYALVYLGFGQATNAMQVWALFLAYGLYYGLTEGAEKALVADLVPAHRRGAAYGWYNLAIGIGAFPAALLFGLVWETAGAPAAFAMGATAAAVAAALAWVVTPRGPVTA